jgi:hypothetical protein
VDSCLVWPGSQYNGRYGRVWFRGKDSLAHRVVWEILHGQIPDGLCVCHICDNPPCILGDHLFLGTQTDNLHDRFLKRRGPRQCQVHNDWYTDKHGHHHCRPCYNKLKQKYRRAACG